MMKDNKSDAITLKSY